MIRLKQQILILALALYACGETAAPAADTAVQAPHDWTERAIQQRATRVWTLRATPQRTTQPRAIPPSLMRAQIRRNRTAATWMQASTATTQLVPNSPTIAVTSARRPLAAIACVCTERMRAVQLRKRASGCFDDRAALYNGTSDAGKQLLLDVQRSQHGWQLHSKRR